tara:strand:+ start:700 stop:1557 length:858 start_codon:yes stop_codon:yes gene_type:complete
MKFPKSRTEILDKIAGIAVKSKDDNDNQLSSEAKKEIRFALMFWNDVEDRSIPDVIYGGLDMELMEEVNPARIAESLDFVTGCEEYQGDRYEQLLEELNKIESKIHGGESFSPMEKGKVVEYCDIVLGNNYTRQEVVNSLNDLGYTMMDRKLTFEFDNAGYSFEDIGLSRDQITDFMKSNLEFSRLSDTVDFRVTQVYLNEGSDAHHMQLQVWHNSKNSVEVADLVTGMIKDRCQKHDMDYASVVMRSEYIADEVPGYKDSIDFHKRERVKKAYERERETIEFSM